MAIARTTLTCTICGKSFEIRKECFNRTQADEYIEWATKRIDTCPECYKAAMQAAEDEQIAVYHLPELTGSEKQIKWATSIRRKCVVQLDEYTQKAAKDEEREQIINAISLLGTHGDSRWWIDHQDDVTNPRWIRKHLGELMQSAK